MSNALRTAANTVATVQASDVPAALANASANGRPKSFAALLARMNGKAAPSSKKAGTVEPASIEVMIAEIPEVCKGLWDIDPVTAKKIGWINARGVQAHVFEDVDGVGGCKGAIYVKRPNIQYTRPMAKYMIANLDKHNRDRTAPAVKRYMDAMNLPDTDPAAWHHVGNTMGFVVAEPGDQFAIGMCNAGHTSEGFWKSGRKVILMDAYFGIPEKFANLADVNIARTAKDTIGRLHRFDKYKDMTEIEGEPLTVTVTAADVKAMTNVQSQALRIISCVQVGKKVKDSEPLPPAAIAQLDTKYGDILEPCVLKCYLLDRAALHDNGKGKNIPGALKLRLSLSHAAASMALLCTTKDDSGQYRLDSEAVFEIEQFFATLVDENETDSDVPPVALRECLETWKLNKMTDQNIRWTALKIALLAAAGEEMASDVESLLATTADDKVYFGSELDPVRDDSNAKEMDAEE